MERARQKLHSRSGATILLALLLFLVAAMVCAVIVSASFTTAKRVHDDKSEEQDYLTVSSAAKLLKKSLLSSSVTYTTTTVYTDDVPDVPVTVPELEGPLGSVLRSAIENPGICTLKVEPNDTRIGTVVMDCTVNENNRGFTITGKLSAEGGKEDSQKIYFNARIAMKSETVMENTPDDELPDGVNKQFKKIETETLYCDSIRLDTKEETP